MARLEARRRKWRGDKAIKFEFESTKSDGKVPAARWLPGIVEREYGAGGLSACPEDEHIG